MSEQNTAGRGTIAFILGGVVIAIAGVVWYLAASDSNIFSRNAAPAAPSVTIQLPDAPVPAEPVAPAEPAAPAD
ncbi:MAG: hypothetical protein JJU15_17520 [Pararhodobacter sp.]|nr:hypothetical protein [Pararhodobacter sp.]